MQQQVSEKVLVEADLRASSQNLLNPDRISVAKSKSKPERSSSTLALKSTQKNSRLILEQSLKLLVKQQVLNLSQAKKAKATSIEKTQKDDFANSERGGAISSHQKSPEGSVIKLQKITEMEKPKTRGIQESKNKGKPQELLAHSIVLVPEENEVAGKRKVDGQQGSKSQRLNKSSLLSVRMSPNQEIVKIPPALSTEPDVQVSERKSRTARIIKGGETSESLTKSPSLGPKNSLAISPYLNSVTIKSGKFQQNRANPLSLYNSNKSIREDAKLPQIEITKSSGVNQAEPLSAEKRFYNNDKRQKQMMRIYQNKQSSRIKTLETRLETSEEERASVQLENSAAENPKKQPRPMTEFSLKGRKSLRKVAKTTQNRSQSIAVYKPTKTQDPISILDELRKETEINLPPEAQNSAQPTELLRKRHKLSNHHVKVVQTQIKLKNDKEATKKKYTRLLKSSIQPILDRLHKRVDSYIVRFLISLFEIISN